MELLRPSGLADPKVPSRRAFLCNVPLITALVLAGSANKVFGEELFYEPF